MQTIRIGALEALTEYTVEITASDTLKVAYRRQHTSDEEGVIEIEIFAEEGDTSGLHAIAVYDSEAEVIAEGEFTIEPAPERDVTVAITPDAVVAGAAIEIIVSGLAAFDSVTAQITSVDGVLIDTVLARASRDGDVTLEFVTPEDMADGRYEVEIYAEGESTTSTTFAVDADDAAEGEAESETDASAGEVEAADDLAALEEPADAAITAADARAVIEPQAAPLGSSHSITVSKLDAGETVTIDVVFAGESVYSSEKTADANGGITLELITSAEDAIGDYTVTVRRASGNQPSVVLTATAKAAAALTATTIGDAEVFSGSLQAGSAELTFDGEAGKYLLVTVTSDDFDPAAAIFDRDEFEIAFNDDSLGRVDAVIGPMPLPYSGPYALEITAAPLMMAQGAIDGDFVATISEVNVAPIAFDRAVPFSLNADAPALYFALPVETGDSLSVTSDSGGGLDTVLQVVAPSGFEYAFDDDSGSGFDAELTNLVFDLAANYVLVLSTFDGGASGDGTITIAHNPVHALEDGEAIITLNDKALRDLVVFDVEEDEYLILNLETLKGDVEDLYVTATIDGMEVMSYSTMGVPDQLPLAFVTPMSGRVVVTLEKFGFDDGISLEVSLQRP